jgi:antagonist of KipI
MTVTITKAGVLTTIQDSGRFGYQKLGVPCGGAMDDYAMRLANIAVGNDEEEAVIEMTMIGANYKFQEPAVICLTGADMNATLHGKKLELGRPYYIKAGSELRLQAAQNGFRTYLAIQGGIQIPPVLQSKSTYVKAQLGGLNGHPLKPGDVLPIKPPTQLPPTDWKLSPQLFSYINDTTIRVIPGKQYEWFTKEMIQTFTQHPYTITPQSDRMGYRLQGETLSIQKNNSLITEGTAFGTIQIPPDGQPIILMADRQPTGGYPKIGNVITVDLPKLAQKRPGKQVRFSFVSIEEAQALRKKRYHHLQSLKKVVQQAYETT